MKDHVVQDLPEDGDILILGDQNGDDLSSSVTKYLTEIIPKIENEIRQYCHAMIMYSQDIPKRLKEKYPRQYERCIVLLTFYILKARLDETNQPWATNPYMAKCLGWSISTVKRYRAILVKEGIIASVKPKRHEDGTTGKHYLRVKAIPRFTLTNGGKASGSPDEPVDINQWLTQPPSGQLSHKCLNKKDKVLKQENKHSSSPAASDRDEYLRKPPMNLDNEQIKVLRVAEIKSHNTLEEVAEWFKREYDGKDKPADPGAVLYSALRENWQLDYYEYGRAKAGYG